LAKPRTIWKGVFPAATTQFAPELSIDMRATQAGFDALVRDGAHGLVLMGTVGEGNSLEPDEKRAVLKAAVECVRGRVPVVAGVSELTTARAVAFARDAEKLGASGLMVLPAMVYVPTDDELVAHFREVASATALPIMLYNNPPAYRVNIGVQVVEKLLDLANVECIKESASDTTRYTDLANAFGDRLTLFAGLDDVALEALLLGAEGWVSGLTNVFPKESLALWDAVQKKDLDAARGIYRWFMPLLHLDAGHDLVQAIKLAEQVVGRGSERVRPPRYPLTGKRRAEVISFVELAAASRPKLATAA
jgi:4-hydroxy-tetrahydrodipicolinate synthase